MPKKPKEKSLEEIYREAREREGPVIIPPQIDVGYLESLEKIAKIEKFGELLEEFEKYQKLAKKNPGKMVHGNVILGAPDTEYSEPSEEEKRLSEIGYRISGILSSAHDKKSLKIIVNSMIDKGTFLDQIEFRGIHFYHVDVVGSGRFFYPEASKAVSFSILNHFNTIIDNKEVKNLIKKIRTTKSAKDKKELFKNLLNII